MGLNEQYGLKSDIEQRYLDLEYKELLNHVLFFMHSVDTDFNAKVLGIFL